MREELEEKIRKMKEHNRNEFKIATERMDNIEGGIKKEVKDRIVESDEHIYAVRTDL